ncbi:D-2-hydroxyacid dehydrogenase [Variovorax sp. KK3]|uniref:D-2-hydroxyacid dehydrogenase n=1 Tax=Variovorax sp. KK3 TaxID=1855728 RepID=UPI00097C950E|nr:D-2-hydroxyacid dehydrogenase [Variovorax sp. KK3]
MSAPLRILLSTRARGQLGAAIAGVLGGRAHVFVEAGPGVDADVAFVSRDVTGLSTKHTVLPDTQRFYDALLGAPSLHWVHVHSAGADRPVFVELLRRGVALSTSSGANAAIVAQTALAGLLALARGFPQLMAAQRERRWAPLIGGEQPRDLAGQTAIVVGWGPIGQQLGAMLGALGLKLVVVRSSAAPAGPGIETVAFEALATVLPRADWLLLACPLSDRTRQLVDARALALLPPGARFVNVARGECVDEPALIAALQSGCLAGAFLDVFAHEPLAADSPLWAMPNVIATPHSAGFSDGNAARVARMFLDNLDAWQAGRPLHLQVPRRDAHG